MVRENTILSKEQGEVIESVERNKVEKLLKELVDK